MAFWSQSSLSWQYVFTILQNLLAYHMHLLPTPPKKKLSKTEMQVLSKEADLYARMEAWAR